MPRLGNGQRSAAGSRLGSKFAVSGSEKDVNSPGLGRPPICVMPRLVDSQACRAVASKQATIRRVTPFLAVIDPPKRYVARSTPAPGRQNSLLGSACGWILPTIDQSLTVNYGYCNLDQRWVTCSLTLRKRRTGSPSRRAHGRRSNRSGPRYTTE